MWFSPKKIGQLGAHPLTGILPDHFLNVQANHLKDFLLPTLNPFEKGGNFGCIDLVFRGAHPYVEALLGNPLLKEKRLSCHPA
jgi:hypothetical protein